MYPCLGYLRSKEGVDWLWLLLVSLFISVPFHLAKASFLLSLQLIVWDGGLSTGCHTCVFACQQRVIKTFCDPG